MYQRIRAQKGGIQRYQNAIIITTLPAHFALPLVFQGAVLDLYLYCSFPYLLFAFSSCYTVIWDSLAGAHDDAQVIHDPFFASIR